LVSPGFVEKRVCEERARSVRVQGFFFAIGASLSMPGGMADETSDFLFALTNREESDVTNYQ